MATYFLDFLRDYEDATGDPDGGGAGDFYKGIGGWRQAHTGKGSSAGALAAGDTLYYKAAAAVNLARFVKITCVDDVNDWDVEDVVRDNGGGAPLWQGVISEIAVGANNKIIHVDLDFGVYDYQDILGHEADGILNTTKTDNGGGAISATTPGLTMGTSGTAGSEINYIACDAAWDPDPTAVALTGSDMAASTDMLTFAGESYFIFQGLDLGNAKRYGVAFPAAYSYGTWINGINVHDATSHGWNNLSYNRYGTATALQGNSCGGDGAAGTSQYTLMFGCCFNNNTSDGVSLLLGLLDSCEVHGNTGWGVNGCALYAGIRGCAIDGNQLGNVYGGSWNMTVLGNRITNAPATKYGIEGNTYYLHSDYNTFYNPLAAGNTNKVVAGGHDIAAAAAGYVGDPDFSTDVEADGASIEFTLPVET